LTTWPEDILFIHYTELAESPQERLHLLGLIGMLLNKLPNSYTAENLQLGDNDWRTLCAWIAQKHGSHFWHLEPQSIRILIRCEKHILMNTSQLLTDIHSLSLKEKSLLEQITFDDIWTLVRHYVAVELR